MVDVSDSTQGDSTAAGNSVTVSGDGYDVDARSFQGLQANVGADVRLDVAGHAGAAVALTTKATGNYAYASQYGGTTTAVYSQSTDAGTEVTAHSHTEAPEGSAGDVSVATQAAGNAQTIGLGYAAAGVRSSQYNNAVVTTDGGGVYGYVSGTASFNAVTAGNDITLSGESGSAARTISNQANYADRTQASQFTAFGNVQDAYTSATVAGNNINAANNGALLDMQADQHNTAYVRSQADSNAYQFGAAVSSAAGVGNAISAGDIGGQLLLDTTQLNEGGGIEAIASFTGTEGYDAAATSSAIGNSVTGYACSDCNGHLGVSNDQTNNVDVGARSVVSVTGSGRSARGSSTAMGNSATYYVSRPSGN